MESDKKFTVGDAISDLSHIPINSQTDSWELEQKSEYAELPKQAIDDLKSRYN